MSYYMYKITGAVNAPVLSAACVPANNSWIELTTNLGRLVSRLLQDQDRSAPNVLRREALAANGVDIVKYTSATAADKSQTFYLVGLSSPLEAKLQVPNVVVY